MTYVGTRRASSTWSGCTGSTVRMLLGTGVTGGAHAGWWTSLSDGDGAPLHVHERGEEVFVLLSGTAIVPGTANSSLLRRG